MDADHPQLARIEQLLREGNALRQQAIELQQQAISLQRDALAQSGTLLEAQRANIDRASQVNEGALAIQQRARRITAFIIPILVLLLGYVSYLLFSRPYL